MRRKYNRRVDRLPRPRGKETHKSFDFAIFNFLKAVKPKQMVGPEKMFPGPELFHFISFIVTVPKRASGDVNDT